MAKVNYISSSPYFDTGQSSWYLAPIKLRDILPHHTDVAYMVEQQYENRPTLLSNAIYGSPAYWWVFMVRNMDKIRDPIWDLKAGTVIMVPSKTRISELIG